MIVTGCDPVSHRFHVHTCYSPSFMSETCMFQKHAYAPCMFQEQYECHTHVSVKLHIHHACNASCIFSKDAESDAAMHQ